jgi:hypothetical protein
VGVSRKIVAGAASFPVTVRLLRLSFDPARIWFEWEQRGLGSVKGAPGPPGTVGGVGLAWTKVPSGIAMMGGSQFFSPTGPSGHYAATLSTAFLPGHGDYRLRVRPEGVGWSSWMASSTDRRS